MSCRCKGNMYCVKRPKWDCKTPGRRIEHVEKNHRYFVFRATHRARRPPRVAPNWKSSTKEKHELKCNSFFIE